MIRQHIQNQHDLDKEVVKELEDDEEKLLQEYREAYQNPRLLNLAKEWEKAGVETWLNYERSKKKPAKKSK